nr:hypothetical protein [Tanacetum cinerariifolium]
YRLNPLHSIKECSSCGALYTMDYCCSDGNIEDKIICDLDQTPDLCQRSPQNCPKCGHLVDGHYCQGCALLRKKFKEDLFTSCVENGILQDSSEPSNDNTNVVNALREPFVVNQDPGKNSSQSPPQINHHCCYDCGDSLEDIFCHQCTCELCVNGAHYGYNFPSKVPIIPDPEPFNNQSVDELPPTMPSFDPTCYYEDGNLFTYDFTSTLVHDSPNVFDPPSQPLFYSCEFCGNDARYGHYCTPQVPFIYPKSCYNQDFNFQQDFHDFQQQYLCGENYGGPHEKIPAFYDDDDDDYTIAITHKEPDNSLSMGDEHLDAIPAMESDEFIKSSVENLVPNPSESEGEYECDVPACEVFTTFSNILFDIDYIFDEFSGELTLLKSIPPGINETDCDPEEETYFIKRFLYDNSSPRPPKEFISENSDTAIESFSPSPIFVKDSDSLMKKIDLSFTPNDPMPPGIEEDDYDSKSDILILEEFLSNNPLSLPENESFHFNIPSSSRPPAKPPDEIEFPFLFPLQDSFPASIRFVDILPRWDTTQGKKTDEQYLGLGLGEKIWRSLWFNEVNGVEVNRVIRVMVGDLGFTWAGYGFKWGKKTDEQYLGLGLGEKIWRSLWFNEVNGVEVNRVIRVMVGDLGFTWAGGRPQSKGHNCNASRPSGLCAQVRSIDDMPFRIRASRGVPNLAKRDFKNLQTTRASLVGSAFASTHFDSNRQPRCCSGDDVPDGSIVASLENINGFLAVNTPPDDLIRTDFKQERVFPKVILHVFEEFVLLLGRHPFHNKVPRMVVYKIGKPLGT